MNCRSLAIAAILAVAAPAAAQTPAPEAPAPAPPTLRVAYVAEGVPLRPEEPAWERATELPVVLMAQQVIPPHGGGATTSVAVRALHDGAWLAIRLEWTDPTADRAVGVTTYRDAAAVGFPTRLGEVLPAPFMGDAQHPVNIWQWTADFDANARGQGTFAERYPHTEGVWYFPQDYMVEREVHGWRGSEPVIELVASGFGTLERQSSQNVRGLSRRDGDRWQVVLRRQLSTGNPEDTQFRPGEKTQMIVAVWDGSGAEVNGRKSVTMMWIPVVLAATIPTSGAE